MVEAVVVVGLEGPVCSGVHNLVFLVLENQEQSK